MNIEQDYTAIDTLIKRLETAPHVDHMALYEQAREQRRLGIERILDEGLTWGEAMGAHRILNQPQSSFEIELRAIKDDLSAQIEIFEHDLHKWFTQGEFPPPHYPMRIAIILRKQKQHDREKRFLAAYLMNFRTKRGCATDEKIVDRARKMGI